MIYQVSVADRVFEVELSAEGVLVDGEQVDVDMAHLDGTPVRSLRLDGASHHLVARREGPGLWELHVRGRRLEAQVVDERTRAIREMTGVGAAAAGPKPVVAPMPGLVVKVEVVEGDLVDAGQGVVIVEAMKMENELRAQAAGVVTRVHVGEGDAVEKGQLLVDLASVPEEDGRS
jgi:pyruvate carboxylase subunit B